MWVIPVASVIGICLTVLGTIYVARRTNSGRVDNSPAAELWTTMRSELARVQARLSEVESRLAAAEAREHSSRLEVLALQAEAAALRREIEELQAALAEAADLDALVADHRPKAKRAPGERRAAPTE